MFQIDLPKKYEKLIGHSLPLFLLSLQLLPYSLTALRLITLDEQLSRFDCFLRLTYYISELIKI